MSSNWLTNEVRWAREQQAKVERQIEDHRDRREVQRMRAAAENEVQRVRYRFRAEMRAALARRAGLSEDELPDTIAKLEADAFRWRQLAEEYTDRIVSAEGDGLFSPPDNDESNR